MAEQETKEATPESEEGKKPGLLKSLLIPVIVGVVCAGVGFAVPMAFPALLGVETEAAKPPEPESFFVTFGDVVVNLNESRMSRYLRLGITLQFVGDPKQEEELTQLIEKKRAIMNSWLLGYLADMSMDDIRGAAGQNRLRREINDQFNWVLFPDGDQQVENVLFEEFNVQ